MRPAAACSLALARVAPRGRGGSGSRPRRTCPRRAGPSRAPGCSPGSSGWGGRRLGTPRPPPGPRRPRPRSPPAAGPEALPPARRRARGRPRPRPRPPPGPRRPRPRPRWPAGRARTGAARAAHRRAAAPQRPPADRPLPPAPRRLATHRRPSRPRRAHELQVKVERALELFNGTEHTRTIVGTLARSGTRGSPPSPWRTPRARWSSSWPGSCPGGRYRVDLGDAETPVVFADKGYELDEIDEALRDWETEPPPQLAN